MCSLGAQPWSDFRFISSCISASLLNGDDNFLPVVLRGLSMEVPAVPSSLHGSRNLLRHGMKHTPEKKSSCAAPAQTGQTSNGGNTNASYKNMNKESKWEKSFLKFPLCWERRAINGFGRILQNEPLRLFCQVSPVVISNVSSSQDWAGVCIEVI